MRRALGPGLCLGLCLAGSIAQADKKPPPESAAVKTGRSWLKLVVETPDPPPASAKKPMAYFVDVPTVPDCAGLTGTATAAVPKLKSCVVAAYKHFNKTPLAKLAVTEMKLERFLLRFDPKLRPNVKAAAKGTKVVHAAFDGDGEALDIYLGIAADGSVRAVWLDSNPVE